MLVLVWAAVGSANPPPNIVYIIGDDHGWDQFGFQDHPFALTPNIDGIAAAGLAFPNAHNTASTCWPSLRTWLSGLDSRRWTQKRNTLSEELGAIPFRRESAFYRTLPRELARRGYASFEGGKMWEGTYADAGFSQGLATTAPSNFFQSDGEEFGREGIDSFREFLDNRSGAPFFAWLAPMLPHKPWDAEPAYLEPFLGLGLRNSELMFLANLLWLDDVVGEILEALDSRGLRGNTLIVYAADNGWELGQFQGGLGRGKATPYEYGVRTTLILSLPGKIPQGESRPDLVSIADLYPTMLDYAGASPVPGREGRSLRTAIESEEPVGREQVAHRIDLQGESYAHFVRVDDWRFLLRSDGSEELYAIVADPGETTNLAAANPHLVQEFRQDVDTVIERESTSARLVDLTGRFFDETGGAGRGIRVELFGRGRENRRTRMRATTDPMGFFRFENLPHGPYGLRLRSAKGTIGIRHPAGQGAFSKELAVTVPMGPGGDFLPLVYRGDVRSFASGNRVLRGRVVDNNGEPVEGAALVASGPHRLYSSGRTGPDGNFVIEGLAADPRRIRVRSTKRTRSVKMPLRPEDLAAAVLEVVVPARH